MRCFLCKKNNFELIYKLKAKNILRCKNDGLFMADATPSTRINFYRSDYFSNPPHPANSNRSYFLNKLLTIRQITNNDFPNILDIGCGWGEFEEVLEMEKIPYLGIDISKESIKICQKKGLNCYQLTIEKLLNSKKKITRNKQIQNNKNSNSKIFDDLKIERWKLFGKLGGWKLEFDCITMFQVIEHVKNPTPLLKSAKKLLKNNGVILITTPNNDSPLRKVFGSRWSIYSEPSHFVFYNKQTLSDSLERAGFKKIKLKMDQIRFLSLNYLLKRFAKMYFNSEFPALPAGRLILNSKFLNIPIPTDPLGDLSAIASV